MFVKRLLSGVILVILLLLAVWVGGLVLWLAVTLVSLIAIFELYRVFKIEKSLLGAAGYLAALLYLSWVRMSDVMDQVDFHSLIFIYLIGLLFFVMGIFVFSYPRYRTEQMMAAFFGIGYVAFMNSCVYLARMLPHGQYWVWLIFISAWGSDTCAYLVGSKFGKHKMAPILSPKKSIEGAVGGVAGAILLAVAFGLVFREGMGITNTQLLTLAAICALGSLVSMVGDLAASAIKRNYKIKDYGDMIPGHGGFLDRFDSVIFTAPLVYVLCLYFL